MRLQVPPAAATGAAVLNIELRSSTQAAGGINLMPVAQRLFTFNSNGRGAPAGYALRVRDRAQTREPIQQLGSDGRWQRRPIDLGPETDQVWLILFGTGLRGRSALSSVTATIGGVNVFVGGSGEPAPAASVGRAWRSRNSLERRQLAGEFC
jgi:hypothetical protein